MFDVIILGGGYAGISAAIQLGRARRRVLVLDAGQQRNRFAAASHGFLGQDGEKPAKIVAKGRAEALAYPTVTWRVTTVSGARMAAGDFVVQAGSDEYGAKRLVLATGVVDDTPDIPGLSELWGKSVFHCPYCDGYELDQGVLGVLAGSALSVHYAVLVAEWGAAGQTTFFLNQSFEPDSAELAELDRRKIQVERQRIVAVSDARPGIEIRLHDGRAKRLAGLFSVPRTRLALPLAEQLGCELETGPTGAFCKTDITRETTVPGVFACGDAALPFSAVAFAVADGVRAGVSAHQSLVFRPDPSA